MPQLSAHVDEETAAKVDEFKSAEDCDSKSDAVNRLLDEGLRSEGYVSVERGDMAQSVARYSLVVAIAWFGIWIGTPVYGAYLVYASAFMIAVSWGMMGYAAMLKNDGAPSSLRDIRRSVRGWLS
jgi:hypothetical protein